MKDETAALIALAENLRVDSEDLKEILSLFFSTIPKQIEEMKVAIEREDFRALHATSHTLKGTSANLLYDNISKTAAEIEAMCLKKATKGYTPLFNKLNIQSSNAKMKICYS